MIKRIFTFVILVGGLMLNTPLLAQKEGNASLSKKVNVVLVGDSTVSDYKPEFARQGWGQALPKFFNDEAKIVNLAVSGRSSKTFIQQGYWDSALKLVSPGDYVLIQFGHNDSHGKDKPESTDYATDYKDYLKKYVDDVKGKNATPIFITPMHRGKFDKDKITAELQPYADAMKNVAKEKNAVCIDLYASSGKLMQGLGKEGIAPLFCAPDDRTHFSEKGAVAIADLIVKDLLASGMLLANYIKPDADGLSETFFREFGEKVDSNLIPRYSAPELEQAPELDSCEWDTVPATHGGYPYEGASFLSPLLDITGQICWHKETIYVRLSCATGDSEVPLMSAAYKKWLWENCAEIFLHTGGRRNQFVVNAKGAKCFYIAGNPEGCPEGVAVTGKTGSGKWQLMAAIPFAAIKFTPSSPIFVNLRVFAAGVLGNDWQTAFSAETNGYAFLKLVPRMTATGLKNAEEVLSSRPGLVSRHDLYVNRLESMIDFSRHCRMNQEEIKKLIAAFRENRLSASELESAYRAMLNEFLRKNNGENPHGELVADFSCPDGLIRPLNGTNLGPRMSNQRIYNFNEDFKRLHFSYTRLHDAPLDNPGARLVDVPLIFGNSKADPKNPDNYYFAQTDYYIKNTLEQGSQIYYRLGVSIEHSLKSFAAVAPADYNHFAEICAGIVRHYNHGWANGYHLNIKYWEIWNEPDIGTQMWDKDMAAYYRLYIAVAKRLRSEFPEIKIGGPALCYLDAGMITDFLRLCKDNNAPVDFISWHCYGNDVNGLARQAMEARVLANKNGFRDAELHLNEWHYLPTSDWTLIRGASEEAKKLMESDDGMFNINSGVFNTAVMTKWQDTPLDIEFYYATNLARWGLVDFYGRLNKNYYSHLAYGEMTEIYKQRIKVEGSGKTLCMLGGTDGKGNGALLISDFKGNDDNIAVTLKGIKKVSNLKVRILDSKRNLEEMPVEQKGNRLLLKKSPGSAAILATFSIESN